MGRLFSIIYYTILVLALTGCFGVVAFSPSECENEFPTTKSLPMIDKNSVLSSKADFSRDWGKPDTIKFDSNGEEIWIYERPNLWCGVIPCIGLCIPLLLPVCDGFDHVYFQESTARQLHTRVITKSGAILLALLYAPGASSFSDEACKQPSISQNILPNKTLFLLVEADIPEDPDFVKFTSKINGNLSSQLAAEHIFKALASSPETADYSIYVKITLANISEPNWLLTNVQKKWNHAVRLTVKIYKVETHQLIANYNIFEESESSTPDSIDETVNKIVKLIIARINTTKPNQ